MQNIGLMVQLWEEVPMPTHTHTTSQSPDVPVTELCLSVLPYALSTKNSTHTLVFAEGERNAEGALNSTTSPSHTPEPQDVGRDHPQAGLDQGLWGSTPAPRRNQHKGTN